jgi:hypothetical protein
VEPDGVVKNFLPEDELVSFGVDGGFFGLVPPVIAPIDKPSFYAQLGTHLYDYFKFLKK